MQLFKYFVSTFSLCIMNLVKFGVFSDPEVKVFIPRQASILTYSSDCNSKTCFPWQKLLNLPTLTTYSYLKLGNRDIIDTSPSSSITSTISEHSSTCKSLRVISFLAIEEDIKSLMPFTPNIPKLSRLRKKLIGVW